MKPKTRLELRKSIFVIGCIFLGGALMSLGVPKQYLACFFLGGAFFVIMFDLFDYLNKTPNKKRRKK